MVWCTTAFILRRLLAAMALLMLGVSLAVSGHAGSALPVWLARPAVWVHVVAITLWVGSLLPLAYSLKDPMDLGLLTRFSRHIPAVLLVLFLSGGVLVYVQFDAPSSLWRTAYGQVLALKLALLALLLGLGTYNRYRLTRPTLDAQPLARRAMRRVVYVECVVAVAILAVVALWRFTPPPRALSHTLAASTSVFAHMASAAAMADLVLESAAPGQPATLSLSLSKADLTPLLAQEVEIAFSNVQAGVEPIVLPARLKQGGMWQVSDIELPRLPTWHIRIDALITDFERIRLETTLSLE